MLNRILVLLYGKSKFFIPLRWVQKYNWDSSKQKFYLAKKIACCQLSNKMLIFLHLVENETKLLWFAPSKAKVEFLFIIFFYYLCFSLNFSRPLQSSLTFPFMLTAKVATFSMSGFNIFTLAADEDKFQQLLGSIFICMEIGKFTVLPRT